MFFWNSFPMLRVVLLLSAGIVIGIHYPLFSFYPLSVISMGLAVTGFILPHRFTICRSLLFSVIFILLGYVALQIRTPTHSPHHLINKEDSITAYLAEVQSIPVKKRKSWEVELKVIAIKNYKWQQAEGKILTYVLNAKDISEWNYGDRLLLEGSPKRIDPPSNPYEFDFRKYLSYRGIYHHHFIDISKIKFAGASADKGIVFYSLQMRKWVTQKIIKSLHTANARALTLALLLGISDQIDDSSRKAYADTGTLHVLAISGLHVSILYFILLLLLKPLSGFYWGKVMQCVLSILVLWGFAFVSGLSPSVLRAVTMFSFLAGAQILRRRPNVYNTMACAACTLLMWQPYLIMSVGFQLSFSAVFGIVYLYRSIYQSVLCKNFFIDWLWKMCSMSIAAQLSTVAISLYYFHQFPNYFLVANMVIIPVSTLVLLASLLLIASPWSSATDVIRFMIEFLSGIMDSFVKTVQSWPYSVVDGVFLSGGQCLVLMCFMASIILLFRTRKFNWLLVSAFLALILSLVRWQDYLRCGREAQFIVYSIKGHSAVEWRTQKHSYFWADSSFFKSEKLFERHIRPGRIHTMVKENHSFSELPHIEINSNRIVQWKGKTIRFFNGHSDGVDAPCDIAILSNNAQFDSRQIKKGGIVIVDGTNGAPFTKKITDYCSSQNILIHSVLYEGAYVLTE